MGMKLAGFYGPVPKRAAPQKGLQHQVGSAGPWRNACAMSYFEVGAE